MFSYKADDIHTGLTYRRVAVYYDGAWNDVL